VYPANQFSLQTSRLPMSDDGPTITVTRGKRNQSRRRRPASAVESSTSGWGVPGPGDVVAGLIRGARTAWWAGLGVLAVTRDVGTHVFDALVEEGKSWEQTQRKRREARARQVQAMSEENDAIQIAEDRVREEVNKAVQRVGMPSREEVDALREQVDALSSKIERLTQSVAQDDS